jgi:hypothetical protein
VYAGAADVAIARAVGSDRELSGMKKGKSGSGTKLKAVVMPARVAGTQGAGWVAKATPAGQWALVESGAKPHLIGTPNGKGGSRRRPTRRQQALAVGNALTLFGGGGPSFTNRPRLSFGNDEVAYGPVRHTGTRGKYPFRNATKVVEPRAKATWETTYVTQTIKLLAGG